MKLHWHSRQRKARHTKRGYIAQVHTRYPDADSERPQRPQDRKREIGFCIPRFKDEAK